MIDSTSNIPSPKEILLLILLDANKNDIHALSEIANKAENSLSSLGERINSDLVKESLSVPVFDTIILRLKDKIKGINSESWFVRLVKVASKEYGLMNIRAKDTLLTQTREFLADLKEIPLPEVPILNQNTEYHYKHLFSNLNTLITQGKYGLISNKMHTLIKLAKANNDDDSILKANLWLIKANSESPKAKIQKYLSWIEEATRGDTLLYMIGVLDVINLIYLNELPIPCELSLDKDKMFLKTDSTDSNLYQSMFYLIFAYYSLLIGNTTETAEMLIKCLETKPKNKEILNNCMFIIAELAEKDTSMLKNIGLAVENEDLAEELFVYFLSSMQFRPDLEDSSKLYFTLKMAEMKINAGEEVNSVDLSSILDELESTGNKRAISRIKALKSSSYLTKIQQNLKTPWNKPDETVFDELVNIFVEARSQVNLEICAFSLLEIEKVFPSSPIIPSLAKEITLVEAFIAEIENSSLLFTSKLKAITRLYSSKNLIKSRLI